MSQISSCSLLSEVSFTGQLDEWDEITPPSEDSDVSLLIPKIRGWVNTHFDKLDINGTMHRVCKVEGCQKAYANNISWGTYRRHYESDHLLTSTPKRTRFIFHDALHVNRFVKCVIACHLSFSIADQPEFRSFIESLNKAKQLVCRKTLSTIVRRAKSQLVDKLRDKLATVDSVALTFDIWSPHKGARGFGCLTAHYISNRGMENIILHFKRMKFPHDAEVILNFISKPILLLKLEGKISAITTDNASNNIAAIRGMDESIALTSLNLGLIHYKCAAHIIDLGLKEGMKQLKEFVRPVREAVMAIRSGRKRTEKFQDKQQELIDLGKLAVNKPLELVEDVDHRWNSLFTLLERAILLQDAIDYMLESEKGLGQIEAVNWVSVSKLCKFLMPFYEATKRLCSGTDATISAVGYIIPRLIEHCELYELEEEEWIVNASKSLSSKLTRYQLDLYHPVVDLAYFLDPRYKTLNSSEEHRKLVTEKMRKLIEDTPMPALDSRRSSFNSIAGYDSDTDDQFDELASYAEHKRELMKTDIFVWWRLNASKYPKLSVLARKLLCIQATSVPSERVFSEAKNVDTPIRNRLADESVESIVLFKSWMRFLNIE